MLRGDDEIKNRHFFSFSLNLLLLQLDDDNDILWSQYLHELKTQDTN